MSFLKVNGVIIPVADKGIAETNIEVAAAKRAFSGKFRSHRRAVKRTWRVTTAPMNWADAESLRGWLTWAGQYFPYDTDVFSARGLPVNSGTAGNILPSVAADGASVYTDAKFGAGALLSSVTATNLMSVAQSSQESGLAVTNSGGATGTQDTAHFYQGTKSLKVVTAGSDGVRGRVLLSSTVSAFSSTYYSGSCYLYGTTGSARLGMVASDGATVFGPTINFSGSKANTWVHTQVAMTTSGAASSVRLFVEEDPADQSITFWADAFMVEINRGTYAWVIGGSARPAGVPQYTVTTDLQNANALTVMAWAGPSISPTATVCCLAAFDDLSGRRLLFLLDTATGLMSVATAALNKDAFTGTYTSNAAITVSDWQHLVWVYRDNGVVEFYSNGTKLGTATISTMSPYAPAPAINTMKRLTVGKTPSFTGYDWWAPIDDLLVLPYAASSTMVQNVYGQTSSFASMPNFTCDGIFSPDAPMSCTIHDVNVSRLGAVIGGSWQKAAGILTFTMAEL